MDKIKHTPGPWKYPFFKTPETEDFVNVSPDDDTHHGIGWKSKTIQISNQADEILAEVKAYDTDGFLRDFDQWQANCKLICAAPELLEALQGIMTEIDKGSLVRNIKNDDDPSWAVKQLPLIQTLSRAATAIRKATE